MDALVKLDVPDTVMEIYFPCPLCQQNYLSVERVQEHIANCYMQTSSFWIPNTQSYSSASDPQALDQNFKLEGLPIRQEIIRRESADFAQDHQTDWQDEPEESTLRNPAEIYQNAANHGQPELQKTRPEAKILPYCIENPNATCKEDQHQYEDCHARDLKYSCDTEGEQFAKGTGLMIHHRTGHQCALVNERCFPGCVKTCKFSQPSTPRIHQNTHPTGLWNENEERSGIFEQSLTSDEARASRTRSMDNKSTINHAKRPKKVIAKEIIPNFSTTQQPSHSPQKIQLNESPTGDHHIPQGSETGRLSPEDTELFTCGICDDSFENFNTLQCHMVTTHAGPEESQTEESEEIGTPGDSSFGSIQSTCEEDQVPTEVKENEATSSLPENLNSPTQQKGPATRYPTVKVGDKKYFYCEFPGCDVFFNNRHARYKHQKKFHTDAYRYMLNSLTDQSTQLEDNSNSEQKANETSSIQRNENSDEEQKTAYMDSPPTFPSVQVNGKKYFWCDVPDCGVVVTNLKARYLHQRSHQMSSEEPIVAENSVGNDSQESKIEQKEPTQLRATSPQILEREGYELLDETWPPNQPEMSDFTMQDDEEMSAEPSMPVLTAILDEDFEGDEQDDMPDLQNQIMDTLEYIVTAKSPVPQRSFINEDFRAEEIFQTDNGGRGSPLPTEANTCNSFPVRCNMPKQTSKETAVPHPPAVKDRKRWRKGRRARYPTLQVGSTKLFPCAFPGCKGVFNSPGVRYMHHKRHRMGFKSVNSKLKLTTGGRVWDSAEGCYLI